MVKKEKATSILVTYGILGHKSSSRGIHLIADGIRNAVLNDGAIKIAKDTFILELIREVRTYPGVPQRDGSRAKLNTGAISAAYRSNRFVRNFKSTSKKEARAGFWVASWGSINPSEKASISQMNLQRRAKIRTGNTNSKSRWNFSAAGRMLWAYEVGYAGAGSSPAFKRALIRQLFGNRYTFPTPAYSEYRKKAVGTLFGPNQRNSRTGRFMKPDMMSPGAAGRPQFGITKSMRKAAVVYKVNIENLIRASIGQASMMNKTELARATSLLQAKIATGKMGMGKAGRLEGRDSSVSWTVIEIGGMNKQSFASLGAARQSLNTQFNTGLSLRRIDTGFYETKSGRFMIFKDD